MTKLIKYYSKARNLTIIFFVILFLSNSSTSSKMYDVKDSSDSTITNIEEDHKLVLTDTIQIVDSLSKSINDTSKYLIEELLKKCIAHYSTIQDYTCVFHKIELVDGELIEEKDITYKFKKPLCYYLKWPSGSEAIYVLGNYNDKLKYHSGNIFGFIVFSLDPRGYLAMIDNRHSILDSHIGHIINIIKTNYNRAKINKELTTTFEGNKILSGTKTLLFKTIFPENKDYYGHVININFDAELYLPVKIEVYGWAMELLEMYHLSDLRVNVGLSDIDFDVNNPAYEF